MDDAAPTPSPATRSLSIWQRPVSRRTVLATGAAGAGAAAVAVLWKGTRLSQILNRVRDLTHDYQGALSSPPMHAAPLSRRPGSRGSPAQSDPLATRARPAQTH